MSAGKEPAGAPGSAAQEDPEYQAGVTAIKAKDYASVCVFAGAGGLRVCTALSPSLTPNLLGRHRPQRRWAPCWNAS